MVALLAEGVDRNSTPLSTNWTSFVALLAEGVDRNIRRLPTIIRLSNVALLAEGVDRNILTQPFNINIFGSPSSRRAWIEIPKSV